MNMGSLILGVGLVLVAFGLFAVTAPFALKKIKSFVSYALLGVGAFIAIGGSAGYMDAGYCGHVRTIFGTESSKCDIGWYFQGWGATTIYPHFITVAHTKNKNVKGSSINDPYEVRLADNWSGTVTQTTRFGIPQDEEQFLKMANVFRSPGKLITSTLVPTITASLDSTANLFTMEEYYAGGQRDEFKSEFFNTLTKGRAIVSREEVTFNGVSLKKNTTVSDSDLVDDTATLGDTSTNRFISIKKKDASGSDIRIPHGYLLYGIVVSTAILENLDPDDKFEEQIGARKEAASRRVIAKEERLEQEQQRLLVISKGERDIAESQAAARTVQIQRTTDAQTEKQLALINADRIRAQAKISKETAQIKFEQAEIDSKAKIVTADAEAYQKRVVIEADNALSQKLEAYVETQKVWADAFANRDVPSMYFAGGGQDGGTDSDVSNFLKLQTVKTAKDLNLDLDINRNSTQ